MKRTNLLLLSAVFALGLASCGGEKESKTTESEEPSTSSTSSSTSSVEQGWSEDIEALFREHLYGNSLPFVGLENLTGSYDEERGHVIVDGPEVDDMVLFSYAQLLEKAGFQGEDVSSQASAESGSVYLYELEVETEEGNRFIDVLFGGQKEVYDPDWDEYNTVYASDGNFFLEAYDPYYYEFPVMEAKTLAFLLIGDFELTPDDIIAPPAFEADFYSVSYQNMAIYCYVDVDVATEGDDAGYGKLLEEEGWKIQEEREQGYHIAIAPNDTYQIAYLYDPSYKDLDIYFLPYVAPKVSDHFDAEIIASYFGNWGATPFEVPSLDIEGATYTYYEDPNNSTYYQEDQAENMNVQVSVSPATAEDYSAYLGVLEANGWQCSDVEGAKMAYKQEGQTGSYLALTFDEEKGMITLYIYYLQDLIPFEAWPTAEIATMIDAWMENEITDVLPALVNEGTGFVLGRNYVRVLPKEGDDLNQVLQAYETVMLEAGFEQDEDDETYFYSPNHQYSVYVRSNDDEGYFDLIISEMPLLPEVFTSFPSEYLNELFGYSTPVPALDGASRYAVHLSGFMKITYEEEVDTEAIVAAYIAHITEDLGFAYMNEDSDGAYYVSPDGEYLVQIYPQFDSDTASVSKNVIYLNIKANPYSDSFPSEKLAALLKTTDVVPALDGAKQYFLAYNELDGGDLFGSVTCYYEEGTDLSAIADAYMAALSSEHGYVYDEETSSMWSPNEEISVAVMTDEEEHTIVISFDNIIDGQI